MSIKEQVKELWKLCFNDTDEFIEMYFRLCYNDEVNICLLDKDKVISALQMIPYSMTFCGGEISTSYISGACTHPAARGKGAMTRLLLQSLERMRRQNVLFSFLIPAKPWLFDYYSRMGYAAVFNYSVRHCISRRLHSNTQVYSNTEINNESYHYLAEKMQERPCCIQHTEKDYKAIIEDLLLSSGSLLTAYQNGRISGVAFIVPSTGRLMVNEMFTENQEAEDQLLHKAALLYDLYKATIISPPCAGDTSFPLGMGRIIDAFSVLQLYAAANPGLTMNFELTDEQLPDNNGYYMLKDGKCIKEQSHLQNNIPKISIGELTDRIFAPENPYMSLMLN